MQQENYGSGEGLTIEQTAIDCFCCGICCYHRINLTLEEARRIADDQGLKLEDILDFNDDAAHYNRYWYGDESFVLQQRDGFCIFLKGKEGIYGKYCSIHHVKPNVCRHWQSSWLRRECQSGLALDWQLSFGPTGVLQGPAENLKKFNDFLEMLEKGLK